MTIRPRYTARVFIGRMRGRQYRFGEEEIMIFGLDAQILENRVGPEALHMIPVFNLAVSNGVVNAVSRSAGSGQGLVSNEEIQVLSSAFSRQMRAGTTSGTTQESRLACDCRSSRGRGAATSGRFRCNGSRKDEGWRVITGETWAEGQSRAMARQASNETHQV